MVTLSPHTRVLVCLYVEPCFSICHCCLSLKISISLLSLVVMFQSLSTSPLHLCSPLSCLSKWDGGGKKKNYLTLQHQTPSPSLVCLQAKELPTFKDNDFLNEGQKLQIGDENKKYFLEKLKRDVEVLDLLMLSEVLSHWGPHSVRLCTVLEYYQFTLSGTADGNEVISKLKIKTYIIYSL